MTENCTYCGDVTPHRSSGPATDDTDEVCLDCGYVITKAKNHVHKPLPGYQFDDDSHWQVCGCGEILNMQNHLDANGDEKCDLCNRQEDPSDTQSGADPEIDSGTNDTDQPGGSDETGKNLTWLWITIVAVAAVGGGVFLYLFVFKKKENDKNAK